MNNVVLKGIMDDIKINEDDTEMHRLYLKGQNRAYFFVDKRLIQNQNIKKGDKVEYVARVNFSGKMILVSLKKI